MRKDGFAGYLIKEPSESEGRASFSLSRITVIDGKRKYLRIADDRLNAINKQFSDGKITKSEAKRQIEDIKLKLTAQETNKTVKTYSSENLKLLELYKRDVIDLRQIKDPAAEYNKFRRAIEALGSLSLRTATQSELQKIINSKTGNVQKKIVSSFDTLLTFAGRTGVTLSRKYEEDPEIQYLQEGEFKLVLKNLPKDIELLAPLLILAWGTGCRNGELHGLRKEDLVSKDILFIQRQKLTPSAATKRGKEFDITKNRKKRRIVPLSAETIKAFHTWVSADVNARTALRFKAGEILQKTCQKLFPVITRAHGRMHMLRASHCVELIGRGVSISIAALQLGDSVEVTQRYYAGFVHTDSTIESLQKLLK